MARLRSLVWPIGGGLHPFRAYVGRLCIASERWVQLALDNVPPFAAEMGNGHVHALRLRRVWIMWDAGR